MWILVTNTIGNIAIYAILFNIIYSILFSGIRYPKSVSVIAYILVMEIKLFIAHGRISSFTFFTSIVVYLLLGLGIVILLDKIANYKPKKSVVIIGIIIGYLADLLLVRILFVAVSGIINIIMAIIWIIIFIIKSFFTGTANIDWF